MCKLSQARCCSVQCDRYELCARANMQGYAQCINFYGSGDGEATADGVHTAFMCGPIGKYKLFEPMNSIYLNGKMYSYIASIK